MELAQDNVTDEDLEQIAVSCTGPFTNKVFTQLDRKKSTNDKLERYKLRKSKDNDNQTFIPPMLPQLHTREFSPRFF